MLRRSEIVAHRTGRMRSYVLRDSTLLYTAGRHGVRTLTRTGVATPHASRKAKRVGDLNATEPSKHAFPLLSHTDFGYHDHAANTKWIQLANYMPRFAKGCPPWWRGADTYSPLYSEQGRYEYQRYMQIARFPFHYKQHFQEFLRQIRATDKSRSPPGAREYVLPQEALHWLLRMIVDNFNPQHSHYLAAMQSLVAAGEYDTARQVWLVMERQQTWPDDKLIACYLELCALAREKTWAVECWNRYCNEKRFLDQPGEADPKPVARVPFTLNRDELLYLPKWKKFFDHDPNLDVADLNRFNTTRNIYRCMCLAMIATGEVSSSSSSSTGANNSNATLFETFFGRLESALLSTPTPVPEPPHPQLLDAASRWGTDPNRDARRQKQWTPDITTKARCNISEMHCRFLSNEQFLVRTVTDCIAAFAELPADGSGSYRTFRSGCSVAASDPSVAPPQDRAARQKETATAATKRDAAAMVAFCDRMLQRLQTALGADRFADVDKNSLFATVMAVHRYRGGITGEQSLALLKKLHGASAAAHPACYLEVLRAFADESAALMPRADLPPYGEKGEDGEAPVETAAGAASGAVDPKRLLAKLTEVATQLADSPSFEWTAEHHFAILRVLVHCGTLTANKYFVTNVLRKFRWNSDFCELLYLEYRRNPAGVDAWAEQTKRMLVWTERYNVRLSERCKRLVERDYDVIRVQVRSFREVAVFAFRHAAEKKAGADPASQLPNPVTDYVSHALPFPDRDTGYPNEYGDIGQWRDPASGVKGPPLYAPAMPAGDTERGYTAEWKENTATANSVKLAAPFDRKYAEYNRGRHPSYDQIYAGPYPEIFPTRYDFRRPTRWDFQDVERQSKFKIQGPYG